MDHEIRRFAQVERFIKEHPKEAEALVFKWQEFAKKYPETSSFETAREFYTWAHQHNIDPNIWSGKEIQDAYFYIRGRHEDQQMQTGGRVNPSDIPAYLPILPLLAVAFIKERPRIMEDDKDYQKIKEELKKEWLKKNSGKDFSSKEGIDYLYGRIDRLDHLNTGAGEDIKTEEKWEDQWAKSVGVNLPKTDTTIDQETEALFRANPKFAKRVERYDKEKKKIYRNPNDDPVVANLIKTAKEHTNARQKYLNAPSDIRVIIEKDLSGKFIKNYREKADAYTKKGGNIFKTQKELKEEEEERKKRKKTLPERAKDLYDWYNSSRTPIRVGRTVGRFAGRAGLNIARVGGRFAIQGTRATITGIRTTIQAVMLLGRAGAVLVSNPIGWIVIGVIIAIIIIVFLIILLAGGGEDRTLVPGRLYECSPNVNAGIPFDYATSPANCSSGPDVDCTDPDGKATLVVDGNTCAANTAAYYSKKEGVVITANCIDKCVDSPLTKICSPDINNNCPDPNLTCQGSEGTPVSGAGSKTFCIEYVVQTPTPTGAPTPFPTNAPTPTPSPTLTPTPTPGPCGLGKIEKTIIIPQADSSAAIYTNIKKDATCACGNPLPGMCGNAGSGQTYSASNQVNNIPLNFTLQSPLFTCSVSDTYRKTTYEAVFNFSGFNIPLSTEILSATLFSPTTPSPGCEAGFVKGRIGTVSTTDFSYSQDPAIPFPWFIANSPSFSTIGNFGNNAIVQTGSQNSCGNPIHPVWTCGNSGLPSGTGDVKTFIQNSVNISTLTAVSFLITPDYKDYYCGSIEGHRLDITANFSANTTATASLTITYCE